MAEIITKDNKSEKVKEGKNIRDACEKLGVPFNCKDGICGTCMIDVLEGEENLSELTEQENDLARDKTHRLACQCQLKKGKIKIDF